MSPRILYDLRGLKCPLPVLKARRKLSTMQSGEELEILTSDPMAVIDIPHLAQQDGHAVLSSNREEFGHRFVLIKG